MFRVKPHETKTLSWWNDQKDQIDLNPVYQRRGNIWPEHDRAYLIDSILNGFDVPKIYVADFTYTNTELNENSMAYAVIDGKQRLKAVFDFFEGELVLDKVFKYIKNPEVNLSGYSFKDLKAKYPKIASEFENYNLSVMSVITDSEGLINDLFLRLNRSKPLTGAEIRNAMKGELPALIREVAEHDFFKNYVRFQTSRGEDKNTAAKLLLVEFKGKFVDTKRVHLDKFVEEGIQSESTGFRRVTDKVLHNIGLMCDVFVKKDFLLSSQGNIPVLYKFISNNYSIHKNILRSFLVDFENKRKHNKQRAKVYSNNNESPRPNEDLLHYDVIFRSANDQLSLIGRLETLERYFQKFFVEQF